MSEATNKAISIINERFGKDTLLSLATLNDNHPSVRIVNSYYEDGAFYIITYALSNKIKQIRINPSVAVCGEWFTANGVGENIGHPHDKNNIDLMTTLRSVFSSWYNNGHVNESDSNTCILCIRLTDGILFSEGIKYKFTFN